jgi:hypothetical protein
VRLFSHFLGFANTLRSPALAELKPQDLMTNAAPEPIPQAPFEAERVKSVQDLARS